MGLLAKQGTPKEIVKKLSEALRHALASKELVDRFRTEGADGSFVAPEIFNEHLTRDVAQMAKTAAHLKLIKE
jgi:tripartite-type tricarboxylate transporter receptor subunit TctC